MANPKHWSTASFAMKFPDEEKKETIQQHIRRNVCELQNQTFLISDLSQSLFTVNRELFVPKLIENN